MSSIQIIVYDQPPADPVKTSLLYYWQSDASPPPPAQVPDAGGRHAIFRIRDQEWGW